MKKYLLLLALLVAVPSCSQMPPPEVATLTAVSYSANVLLDMLLSAYEKELMDTVDRSYKAGDSKAEAEARVAAVIEVWRPLWRAWETLRTAQSEAIAAVQGGGVDIENVRRAYCNLLMVWPSAVGLPLSPFNCEVPNG